MPQTAPLCAGGQRTPFLAISLCGYVALWLFEYEAMWLHGYVAGHTWPYYGNLFDNSWQHLSPCFGYVSFISFGDHGESMG